MLDAHYYNPDFQPNNKSESNIFLSTSSIPFYLGKNNFN